MSSGGPCAACDGRIEGGDAEIEAEFEGGAPRRLRFHGSCFWEWDRVRMQLEQRAGADRESPIDELLRDA